MKIIFELAINCIEAYIITHFLIEYLGYKAENKKSCVATFFMLLFSFINISITSMKTGFSQIGSSIQIMINIVFSYCYLKGKICEKILSSVLIITLSGVISVGTALFFGIVCGKGVAFVFDDFNLVRIVAVIFTKIVQYGVACLLVHIKKEWMFSLREALLFITIPICAEVVIGLLLPIANENLEIQSRVYGCIIMLSIVYSITLYLFSHLSKIYRFQQEYERLELDYKFHMKQNAEAKKMLEEIKAIRHDLKNHLVCIEGIAKKENCDDICSYIHEVTKNEVFEESNDIYTGNVALDTIINTKVMLMKQENIEYRVMISKVDFPMTYNDICVLFGNLLDNAIDAVRRNERKYVGINIKQYTGYVFLRVENSIQQSVLQDNVDLSTTKLDIEHHGYGVKNIKRIVDKYNGVIEYGETTERFICDILFFI